MIPSIREAAKLGSGCGTFKSKLRRPTNHCHTCNSAHDIHIEQARNQGVRGQDLTEASRQLSLSHIKPRTCLSVEWTLTGRALPCKVLEETQNEVPYTKMISKYKARLYHCDNLPFILPHYR